MDIGKLDVAKEIGAVYLRESAVKFLYYDVISGELMDKDLIKEARKVEKETFKKHGCTRK